jgi:hypothetical protein
MREVYRARDTKLDREVAIKVLPASVSRDPDREIYFLAPDDMLMAAPVTGAAPFQTGTPTPLFKVAVPDTPDLEYDVSPDGKRFLVNQQTSSKEDPITVVVNWSAALKKP